MTRNLIFELFCFQIGSLRGHALPINRLTFSPSGRQLITVSNDQKVKIWSGTLGQEVNRAGKLEYGPASATAFGRTGEQISVGYHHGHLRVFDVNSGNVETLFYMHSIINCKDAENCKYYLKFSKMWHQPV